MHAATPTRRSGEEFERRTRGTVIVSSSSMLSRLGAESRRCDISAMADPKAEPRPFRKSHPGACELGALANFWAPSAREAPILAMPRLARPLHLEAVKETCETHCAITTLHIRLARPSCLEAGAAPSSPAFTHNERRSTLTVERALVGARTPFAGLFPVTLDIDTKEWPQQSVRITSACRPTEHSQLLR
jgi:hypothetical protein